MVSNLKLLAEHARLGQKLSLIKRLPFQTECIAVAANHDPISGARCYIQLALSLGPRTTRSMQSEREREREREPTVGGWLVVAWEGQ